MAGVVTGDPLDLYSNSRCPILESVDRAQGWLVIYRCFPSAFSAGADFNAPDVVYQTLSRVTDWLPVIRLGCR